MVIGLVLSGDDVNVHILTNLDAVDLHAKITEQDLVCFTYSFSPLSTSASYTRGLFLDTKISDH